MYGCTAEVKSQPQTFRQLQDILGKHEAIVLVKKGKKAFAYQVNAEDTTLLFETDLVKRFQDIFGYYWDMPVAVLSSDREKLFYETAQPLVGSDNLHARQVGVFDFKSRTLGRLPKATGDYYILRLERAEKQISRNGSYLTTAGRKENGTSMLMYAKIRGLLELKEVLLGTRGSSPFRRFAGLTEPTIRVKEFTSLNEWALGKSGTFVDIDYVDWLPDETGFIWQETITAVRGGKFSAAGQEVWHYSLQSKKAKRIASFKDGTVPAGHLSSPLYAVSDRYALWVGRKVHGKSTSFTNYLCDVRGATTKQILDSNSRIVGIR